jgi:prolyl 4-hydroxylase
MIEHNVNKLQNFISGWYLDDLKICDELIKFYKLSKKKYPGVIGDGLDRTKKSSTDVSLDYQPLWLAYVTELQKVLDCYKKEYPWCDKFSSWGITETVNIQHYAPKEGYFSWHTERSNTVHPAVTRHLVFMTYLNDVTDQGETEWFHQKIKIQPKKGLTVIWPADWTFVHRGISSNTQDKYIVTGWLNYLD